MHRSGLRLPILTLVGIAALGIAWWAFRSPTDQSTHRAASGPRYIGDSSCSSCHKEITESYRRTAMGRAWYRPSSENVNEDYSVNNRVYDAARDLHYEMLAKDGRYFQREYRLNDAGQVVHELVRQATHIIGSGEHVRSYASDAYGYLVQLPISWFSEKQCWDLSPGYKDYNHRFYRPITPPCIACHSNYATHVPGTLNKFIDVPNGIGCERCHGPAEWHVRQHRDGWSPPDDAPEIINPARLSTDLRDDVCFQCHLQGDVQFAFPDVDQFGFRPGLRLRDFRCDYVVEAVQPAEFGVASHATRMVMSRCYSESKRELGCITCHDPHVPLKEAPADSYRRACITCHTPRSCKRVDDGSAAHRQDDCVACHMPRGEPADVQHTVFTDHWIQRAAKPFNGRRDRKHVSAEPAALRDFWNDPRHRQERLGMAHLAYAFSKGGQPDLEYGLAMLKVASKNGPLHRDGWRRMGQSALARQDAALARSALLKVIESDPNDGMALLGLASAARMLGDRDDAQERLRRAIAAAPDLLESYGEAAGVHIVSDEYEQAALLLEESLRRNPIQLRALANLGTLYSRDATTILKSIDAYTRAIQLDPDAVDLRFALASVYVRQNESKSAIRELEAALARFPRHVPALLLLAQTRLAMNEPRLALDCLEKALEIDPKNQEGVRMRTELETAVRKEQPAATNSTRHRDSP